MAGIFPPSGVPASDAYNSLPNPNVAPGCDSLWYSTSRCQPRFDPSAANAMLSELVNLSNCSGRPYDCLSLDNLCKSVSYMIQQGKPAGGLLYGGPTNYFLTLDPPVLEYTDYMTLLVVPNMDNAGAVKISINGLPAVPILRNDAHGLRTFDMQAGRPMLIAYWAGYFFVVGLVASQVPIVLTNSIDIWVRPDGNDVLGDGTANTPDKAFETIDRAFASFASRYASSSLFQINIRLGIPGDYKCAYISNCSNVVNIVGDPANYAAYRILCDKDITENMVWTSCLWASQVSMNIYGVTFVLDHAAFWTIGLMVGASTNVVLWDVNFETPYSFASHDCIWNNGYLQMQNNIRFNGLGETIRSWLVINHGDTRSYEAEPNVSSWVSYHFENMTFANAGIIITSSGSCALQTNFIGSTNVVGPKYAVTMNGVLEHWKALPGSTAGTLATGGQYQSFFP